MLQEQDDDDYTVFDRTSLLGKRPQTGGVQSPKCGKILNTLALCGAFFGCGLAIAIPGPTLSYLRCHVGATLQSISYIFPARSLGYLVGSVAGGFLFDRFANMEKLLVAFSLILAGMTIGVAPWTSSLALLCIGLSITSIAMGFLDTGGNVICLKIWGKDSGPYMQALHFSFGLGACIAPLVAAPFLSSDPGLICNVTLQNMNNMSATTVHVNQAAHVLNKRQYLFTSSTIQETSTLSNFKLPDSSNITNESVTATSTPATPTTTGKTTTTNTTTTMTSTTTRTPTNPVHRKPSQTGDIVSKNTDLSDASGNRVSDDLDENVKLDLPTPVPIPTSTVTPKLHSDTNKSETAQTNSTVETKNNTILADDSFKNDSSSDYSSKASATTEVSTLMDSVTDVSGSTLDPDLLSPDNIASTSSVTSGQNSSASPEVVTTVGVTAAVDTPITTVDVTVLNTTVTTPTTAVATPFTTTITIAETIPTNTEITTASTETTPASSKEPPPVTDITTTTTPTTTISPTITLPTTRKPTTTTPASSKEPPPVTDITTTTTPTTTISPTTTLPTTFTPTTSKPTTTTPTTTQADEVNVIDGHKPRETQSNGTDSNNKSFLEKAKDTILSISSVQFSYLVIGIVMISCGIIFCCLHSPRCSGTKEMSRQKSENDLHEVADRMMTSAKSRSYKTKLMVAVFVFFFLYVGSEVAYGQFIATFGTHHTSKLTEQQAAFLTSIFWGAFALTRGLCIPVSKFLSANSMLIISVVIAVCSSVGLTIATTVFVTMTSLLWFLTASLGVGMAAIFPTGVLWLEGYITVTSKMAAVFVCASALGEMLIPFIVGQLIDHIGPLTLMFTMLVSMICCTIAFLIMRCIVSTPHSEYRQLGSSVHKEKDSLIQMQEFEFSDDSDATDSEPILKKNGVQRRLNGRET